MPLSATWSTSDRAADALAADTVGARLLGFRMQAVRHLFEAQKLNLGEAQLSQMDIRGLPLGETIRHFTRRAYGVELDFEHA